MSQKNASLFQVCNLVKGLLMSFKRIYLCQIFIFCAAVGGASHAHALQIKLVQQGQVFLDTSALSAEWTLAEPVDPEKSLLTAHVVAKTFPAREAAFNVAVYFLDRRTVRIIRQKSGAELEVSITIAEFKSGVKVTRGVTQFAKDIYQKRVVIPRLQNKSSIVTTMATSVEFDQDDGAHLFFSSYFLDSNTLSIMRSEGAEIKVEGDSIDTPEEDSSKPQKIKVKKEVARLPVPEATVYWQIAEFFDGVKITQGTAKIPHFSKDTNAYFIEN